MSGVLDVLAGATGAPPPEFGSTAGGSLYVWGHNGSGQLGLGNATNYSSPKQVDALTNWSSVTNNRYNGTLAIKTDGTLWSWGYNGWGTLGLGNKTSYNSPKQVGALTNWAVIDVDTDAVAAIKTDGTLWVWGRGDFQGVLGLGNLNNYSSPKQVGALTNWKKIARGTYHTLAIKTDGTLWSWGRNNEGQLGLSSATIYYWSPKQVGALATWDKIDCGYMTSFGIKTDGTLWSWGSGGNGGTGNGSSNSPKQVGTLTNWLKVSADCYDGGAIKTDGTLWTWGNNANGEAGQNNTTTLTIATRVGSDTNWLDLAVGYQSLATKTNGTLWSCGANDFGQLGLGDTTNRSTFAQIGSLTTWGSIGSASGSGHCFALTAPKPTVPDKPTNVSAVAGDTNATVTFTAPSNGGSTITSYTVTAYTGGVSTGISTSGVTTSIKITGLTNGTAYTFTVKATNAIGTGKESPASGSTLWSYGAGYYGALGLGNTTSYSVPKQVGTLTDWSTVSSGAYESIGIKTDGTLWSWGKNNWGQSGLGNTTAYSSPKQVGALTNWLKVASAYGSVMAIKTDGSLWSWGYNGTGSLGHGNNVNYSSPKQVGALTDWSKIDIWGGFVISTKTDGSLWSWGFNSSGQLGLGNTTNYYSPKQVGALTTWLNIVSGYAHVIATKTNGTLWTWGYNNTKQLGLGNTTNYSSPKQVGALTDWSSIAGGDRHSIATKTDGSLWGWGRNDSGQLGLGTTGNYNDKSFPTQIGALTDWSTVSCGGSASSFATKTDGTLWVFGDNSDGKLGLGDTTLRSSPTQVGSLTTWGSIAPGYFHTLALKRAGSNTVTPEPQTFVDDVFSTYLYTGNGSTQTITNGIDLAGKGGLVWIKSRSNVTGQCFTDTVRGVSSVVISNSSANQYTIPSGSNITSFNSNGFSLGPDYVPENTSGYTFASWTFRKAAKFFDVVTYTGDGTAGRNIAHSLGIAPGMIMVKRTNTTGDWQTWHRSFGDATVNSGFFRLNTTDSYVSGAPNVFGNDNVGVLPTASSFTVGSNAYVNAAGSTYVAYLFAHDTSSTGIIQCGSFTTVSNSATVTLGWEPQYILWKQSDSTGAWYIYDTIRGWSYSATKWLHPNTSEAEGDDGGSSTAWFVPTATGFDVKGFLNNGTFIYMAIRRPNKPPTTGTQVYNAIARAGTGAAATVTGVGFPPDLIHGHSRNANRGNGMCDRLRGAGKRIDTDRDQTELSYTDWITSLNIDGYTVGNDLSVGGFNESGLNYVNHFFKRAPGFFDEVCYTGTGSATTQAHNLGAVPEMIIVKPRNAVDNWCVYTPAIGITYVAYLNWVDAKYGPYSPGLWNNTTPTASVFSLSGSGWGVNNSAVTYVAYLFATLAGVSKVGSYTGNGGTLTVNCGFTAGARFVLIKRTDSTGDWYVWDTARSINPGNEPHLSLNSNAAEVTTDDTMDYDTNGFVVNQVAATNVNVTSATYIYLAIA